MSSKASYGATRNRHAELEGTPKGSPCFFFWFMPWPHRILKDPYGDYFKAYVYTI